jgi:hypothetical protein
MKIKMLKSVMPTMEVGIPIFERHVVSHETYWVFDGYWMGIKGIFLLRKKSGCFDVV